MVFGISYLAISVRVQLQELNMDSIEAEGRSWVFAVCEGREAQRH